MSLLEKMKNRRKKQFQPKPPLEESFEAPEPVKPKLEIEKMERCLHGRSCRHLKSEPPASPMCDKAGLPVWNLEECPLMCWAPKQQRLIKKG